MRSLLLTGLLVVGCTIAPEKQASTRAGMASGDDDLRWARYVRTSVAPRLLRLPAGVRPSEETIKNVVLWGIGEGIYRVGRNGGYAQHGAPQSPLSYSNCLDSGSYNTVTALPDCPSIASGNWQVGIAGLQVGEYIDRLPRLYRTIYGELQPSLLGRLILPWLGEDEYAFPEMSIDDLANPKNAKWASVILRDPAIGVLALTEHPWMRDGIPASYPFNRRSDIVDAAWNDPVPASVTSPTGASVSGELSDAFYTGPTPFDDGGPFFACAGGAIDPCLATFGWPTGGARFERSQIDEEKGRIMMSRLVADAHPELRAIEDEGAIDGAFRAYYESYGGLPVFGYPLGPVRAEGDSWVQSFERIELSRPVHGSFDANESDPVWQVSRATR